MIKKTAIVLNEFTSADSNSTGYLFNLLINKINFNYTVREINLEEFKSKNNLNSVVKSFYLIVKLLRVKKARDVIIVGTNPPLLPYVHFLTNIKKNKSILYILDLFPQNLVAANILSEKSFIYKLLIKIQIYLFSKYTAIVVIGRDMEKTLIANGLDKNKIYYAPIIIPISNCAHQSQSIKVVEDILRIQFFGNIGVMQGLKTVIEKIVSIDSKDFRLDVIGEGKNSCEVRKIIEKADSKNICYYPSVPMRERNTVLATAHYSLVALRLGSYGVAVPSKAYFSFSNGIPVIAILDEGSELSKIILQYDLGYVLNANNLSQLDTVIQKCKLNYENYKKEKILTRYRQYILENDKFSEVLQLIL